MIGWNSAPVVALALPLLLGVQQSRFAREIRFFPVQFIWPNLLDKSASLA